MILRTNCWAQRVIPLVQITQLLLRQIVMRLVRTMRHQVPAATMLVPTMRHQVQDVIPHVQIIRPQAHVHLVLIIQPIHARLLVQMRALKHVHQTAQIHATRIATEIASNLVEVDAIILLMAVIITALQFLVVRDAIQDVLIRVVVGVTEQTDINID